MSVRRSLAWAYSGQFIAFAVQFGGSVVIARLLSPHELGIFAIAMAAVGIIQIITSFGIVSYIVRETNLTTSVLDAAFTINAILILSLCVALTAFSFGAGPILGEERAGAVLRIIAAGTLLNIVSFRSTAMMQREMQFKPLSLVTVVNGMTQTLTTIAFALKGASYMSPAYGFLLATLASTLMTLRFGHRHLSFRVSVAHWRPITVFGLQMMSVTGVATITGRLSDLILGRVLGVGALGLYSRASNLSALIFENLYGTATRIAFVQLTKDFREDNDWRGTYLRSFAMITAVMWPLLIGLALLSRPAVLFLYGERWLPAALPLSALMVAQFFGVAFGMNFELFVLRGETGRQSKYEVVRLLVGLPLFAVGCLFGIVTAAIAKIGDALIALVLYYPHVRRLTGIGPRELPAIYRTNAGLTLAAVTPSAILMVVYGWSPYTPLPMVAAAVLLGMAMWLGLVVIGRHPLRDELLILLRRARSNEAVAES